MDREKITCDFLFYSKTKINERMQRNSVDTIILLCTAVLIHIGH